MTKQDFELIARAVREAGEDDYTGQGEGFEHGRFIVASCLAESLAKANPRFDRTRFLKACGVDETA